jgi:peptidoglycan/LPS O-acetylase OafA/YrhL
MTLVDDPVSAEFDRSPAALAAAVPAHIAPLDGLRGLAILLVIVPHIAGAGMLPGPAWLVALAGSAAHGVDIFFVLSGFGLAYPLLAQRFAGRAASLDTVAYAFNRAYRILPPFYVAIAVAYAVLALAAHVGRFGTGEVLYMPHSVYEALAPLLLLDRANFPANPGLWTIAVQARWYVLFPLFLLLWMKSPRAFAAVAVCAWTGFLFTRTRTIDLGTLPLFMLGIVAAEMVIRQHRLLRYAVVLLPIAVLASLAWDPHAVVPDPWEYESHFSGQPTSFPWHIVAFALVLVAATVPFGRSILGSRPLAALGTASFSIYLVHQPVIALVHAVWGPDAGALAFAGSIAGGAAFWWCCERPLIDSARRRRWRERARPLTRKVLSWVGVPPSVQFAPARSPVR